MNNYSLHPKVNIKGFGAKNKHYFFGYYDKCPWSADGRYLLAHEVDFIDHLPDGSELAAIGYFDLEGDKKFHKLAETRAWNFQQGSMLQWLGRDYNKRIIFNDFKDGKFISVILDINSGERKEIPFPVYAVNSDGKSALSLDFSLLDDMREGYGYKGINNSRITPEDDGIYLCNLANNKKEPIISLQALLDNARYLGDYFDGDGRNWADHLTFSPSGTHFAFFHRWQLKNGGLYSQLCVANKKERVLIIKDLNNKRIRVLLDSGMASHFSWLNHEKLVGWGRLPKNWLSKKLSKIGRNEVIKRIILPVYHYLSNSSVRQKISGDFFVCFNAYSKFSERIGDGLLTEDGHISFSPDKKWLLTDTFDSKNHKRGLVLFNLNSKQKIDVGSFGTMPNNPSRPDWDSSNLRCDLHPRLNRDGTQICFDSVHEGTRQMYVLDVSEIVK